MSTGQNQNLVQVVKDYGSRLFGFIRSKVSTDEDAEDLIQDVWYQLSNVTAIDTIGQISGWLYTVAKNKITDAYRKKRPELINDLSYEDEEGALYLGDVMPSLDGNPETEQFRTEIQEALFLALEELPENQRLVFIQNELEDKTLQEIADDSGENLKTIISRKRYAIQHLRNRLQYLYDDLLN